VWRYVYRTIDQYGQNVLVSARRDQRRPAVFPTSVNDVEGVIPSEVITDAALWLTNISRRQEAVRIDAPAARAVGTLSCRRRPAVGEHEARSLSRGLGQSA
jgi:transposase-like protein